MNNTQHDTAKAKKENVRNFLWKLIRSNGENKRASINFYRNERNEIVVFYFIIYHFSPMTLKEKKKHISNQK